MCSLSLDSVLIYVVAKVNLHIVSDNRSARLSAIE
jgi:hypothetical protein